MSSLMAVDKEIQDKDVGVSLKLAPRIIEEIRAYADNHEMSFSGAVRYLVKQGLALEKQREEAFK